MVLALAATSGLSPPSENASSRHQHMKRPYPQKPSGAPDGTIWFGGPIKWFSISLIITGDDLNPDQVTQLFGMLPTRAHKKDAPIIRADGTVQRIPKIGTWVFQLTPTDTDEWDVEEAAKLLISQFPADPRVWATLPVDVKMRLSFGLDIEDANNRGFSLSSDILRFVGDRNVRLDFDLYADASKSDDSP
jgi:hypothetical protein